MGGDADDQGEEDNVDDIKEDGGGGADQALQPRWSYIVSWGT